MALHSKLVVPALFLEGKHALEVVLKFSAMARWGITKPIGCEKTHILRCRSSATPVEAEP